MVTLEQVKKIALGFDHINEEPHFEKTSFRYKKKIVATLDEKNNLVCVKLSPIDQASFCSFDKKIIYPVPNKWGQQGWTLINLDLVLEETLVDALSTAYNEVSNKKK